MMYLLNIEVSKNNDEKSFKNLEIILIKGQLLFSGEGEKKDLLLFATKLKIPDPTKARERHKLLSKKDKKKFPNHKKL